MNPLVLQWILGWQSASLQNADILHNKSSTADTITVCLILIHHTQPTTLIQPPCVGSNDLPTTCSHLLYVRESALKTLTWSFINEQNRPLDWYWAFHSSLNHGLALVQKHGYHCIWHVIMCNWQFKCLDWTPVLNLGRLIHWLHNSRSLVIDTEKDCRTAWYNEISGGGLILHEYSTVLLMLHAIFVMRYVIQGVTMSAWWGIVE